MATGSEASKRGSSLHAQRAPTAAQSAPRERAWEDIGLLFLLSYFAVRLIFLALRIDSFVPPDEVTHFGRILLFASVGLLPADGPASYEFGLISHTPWLYYFLMGKLVALAPAGAELVSLRLFNTLLSMATVVFGIRWIRLVSDSTITRLLFTAVMTNVLMFTGLGASVNYDNLTNLLAAAAIYLLFRLHRERQVAGLWAFAGCVLAGCLTKLSFLPLAAILLALFVLREGNRVRGWIRAIAEEFRSREPRPWLVRGLGIALVAALLVANLSLYAGNGLRFGKLIPDFDQVVAFDDALKNRVFARTHVLRSYREGRVSFDIALRMAREIKHPGDRRSTRALLETTRRVGKNRVGIVRYTQVWLELMANRSLGYFGHRVLTRSDGERNVYFVFIGLAVLLLVLLGGSQLPRGDILATLGLAIGYTFVVFWLVNHRTYLEVGLIDLAVQGRYLFPILVPLAGVLAIPIGQLLPRLVQAPLALGIALYFIYGDLPFLLLNASPVWFATP